MDIFTSKSFLTMIAILIGFMAYAPYIWSILKGKSRPHVFSWIIWTLLMGIAFFAQWAEGGGAGSWVLGSSAAICALIVVLALKQGEKEITRSDRIIFMAGLSAIPVWLMTNNPLWSVIIITVIDALGFYPTFRKSYYKPDEEMAFPYLISGLKFVITLFALERLTWTTGLYPFSLVIMNWSFVALLLTRRLITK